MEPQLKANHNYRHKTLLDTGTAATEFEETKAPSRSRALLRRDLEVISSVCEGSRS